jgi:hypothetical protein
MMREQSNPTLFSRLKRGVSKHTVKGSLPVLFFGNFFGAKVATVGLNPSRCEYLDDDGAELSGAARRFESLQSLGAADRWQLTDDACEQAIDRMVRYFDPDAAAYWRWFRPLERVLSGFGVSLVERTATHLDLVQEPTDPVWSQIEDRRVREDLLNADLPFLKYQLSSFGIRDVLCASKTVGNHVKAILNVRVQSEGTAFGSRMKWWVGRAAVQGRELRVGGWNLPLARPHGLNAEGLVKLGRLLREQMSQT